MSFRILDERCPTVLVGGIKISIPDKFIEEYIKDANPNQTVYFYDNYRVVGDEGSFLGQALSLSEDENILAVSQVVDPIVNVFNANTGNVIGNMIESPSGVLDEDQFGVAVSLNSDGSILAVGASESPTNNGSVFTYRLVNNIWTQFGGTLTGDGANGRFGYSLAINQDNILLVGQPRDDSVILYELVNDTWTQIEKISNPGTAGEFGTSVSIAKTGLRFVVGDPVNQRIHAYTDNAGTFDIVSYTETQPDSLSFGFSCSISPNGQNLVVGAPNSLGSRGGLNFGMFAVFELGVSTTTVVFDLISNVFGQAGGAFLGISVGIIDTGLTIASAPGVPSSPFPGEVFLYSNVNGFMQEDTITLSGFENEENGDTYGSAVALGEGKLAITAKTFGDNNDSGSFNVKYLVDLI